MIQRRCSYPDSDYDDDIVEYVYYAVLDDVVVPIFTKDGDFTVGRYIKLYGRCADCLRYGQNSYKVLDKNDGLFCKCQQVLLSRYRRAR